MLTIVCFAMLIGGYFLYDYQGKKRAQERIEKEEQAEKNHLDSMAIIESYKPFNNVLEKEMSEFIATAKKEEAEDKGARRLYFVTVEKDDKGEYLQVSTGYGYDSEKVKGFTRFNGEVIIYYGNPKNVEQEVIDESKLLKSFDEIEFYANQKPEKEAKPYSQRYTIFDKDSLISFRQK